MKLRLIEIQTKKDFKNVKLAELTGLSPQQINYYRSGFRKPPLETLERLAIALECDPLEMLEPGPDYAHFYDPQTGEWLGIRKK
ncbi:helix-turn-helix transcriptional regulator [Chryseobacterium sp. MHB01]|uniref:helix-turn-helix domain-containing protein n=1 Tax=Chryseobacterium sp. MHB01 TaxID=3109433 RepID=UPI002AFFA459|nr:helix-turn-helix transcriptional regulator [Chryseobacterium sp. MHB01]MEA1848958.1 helix-turn-helix transcriptional regulator [Chryseobacterium sp. MHB01]